jgi:hypothetical protein
MVTRWLQVKFELILPNSAIKYPATSSNDLILTFDFLML